MNFYDRSGKVKGIERFLGAVEAVENSLMEVTSGQVCRLIILLSLFEFYYVTKAVKIHYNT